MKKRKVIKIVIVLLVVAFLLCVLRSFVESGIQRTKTHLLKGKQLQQRQTRTEDNSALHAEDRPTDSLTQMVKKRFEHRKALLNRACRMYGNSSLFKPVKVTRFEPMPLFKPAMNIRIRYCGIAKSASTTWNSFLAAIKQHMMSRGIKPSEDWNQAEDEVYFTFVREPYARLWSAYVDKLLTPNELFWRMTGKFIVTNFRDGASEKSRACGHDVTFPEFIKYVIHAQKTGEHRDGHFIPAHDQCDMCHIPYRYIGHLETINEDMPHITNAIHSPIAYNRTYDTDTIRQNARMVFLKSRRERVQQCMDLDEASRRLWKKYQIRGLISKRHSFPYDPHTAVNITEKNFTEAALAAYARCRDCVDRKAQRTESLREAFAHVPLEDKLQLQQMLFLDFQMFGFDPYLEDVFPRQPFVKDKRFSYLSIYSHQ